MNNMTDVSLWASIANTISTLLSDDPVQGFFVVLLSMGVFFGILYGTSSILIKVLRTKFRNTSPDEIFNKERYSLNVIEMVRDLQEFNAERDKLSRDCERRKERTVPKEQMSLARSTIEFIRSSFLLKISDLIRGLHPEDNNVPDDYDEYRDYENALNRVMDEVTKMFDGVARENHLADKTTVEFQSYMEYKINNLKTLIRRVFESYYVSPVLPLKTVMSTYDQDWNESEKHYRKLFVDMRGIALKHKQEIGMQEQDYNSKWSLFIQALPERLIKNTLTKSG